MKKHIKPLSFLLALIMIFASFPISALAVSESDMKAKVISVAQNEVGYEGTSSYSKYGEWYGYQGGWCTTFVLWCFNKAGDKLGVELYRNIVPSGGNCNSMISWYKNKSRYHTRTSDYSPKKGDLVFFDWSGNGSSQHVGIVKSVSGSTVYTIEGNCSGKVKEKTYTSSGSKPYANISSIMGYGSPNWASVAGGSSKTTKKQTTKKQSTQKKKPKTTKKTTQKTTKKQTTKAATKKKSTTKKSSSTSASKTTADKTTTTESTTEKKTEKTSEKASVPAKDLELYAPTYDLQIGDSVKLDYSVKPANASAVVGYFCDEENIIEIKKGGVIKATGEGVATVVVCANDEIYRQVDFTVASVSSKVTKHTPDNPIESFKGETQISEKSFQQTLGAMGINVEKLKSHLEFFIIPAYIIGLTLFLSLLILAIKAIANAAKRKKSALSENEEQK
ncbi:MAG: CHAP domain-containing protein [Eubacterium sp.]|nr:CHAP domain-containing protein [Eubacterium sp.]